MIYHQMNFISCLETPRFQNSRKRHFKVTGCNLFCKYISFQSVLWKILSDHQASSMHQMTLQENVFITCYSRPWLLRQVSLCSSIHWQWPSNHLFPFIRYMHLFYHLISHFLRVCQTRFEWWHIRVKATWQCHNSQNVTWNFFELGHQNSWWKLMEIKQNS